MIVDGDFQIEVLLISQPLIPGLDFDEFSWYHNYVSDMLQI